MLLLIACGAVIGPVIHDAVLVACIATCAGLVGNWAQTLTRWLWLALPSPPTTRLSRNCKRFARSGNYDLDAFLVKMQTLHDIVVDFTPVLSQALMECYDSLAVLEMCLKEEKDRIDIDEAT